MMHWHAVFPHIAHQQAKCCTGVVPSGTWQTKDGKYVVIGGNGDSIYTRLMAAVGRADMGADNADYATNTKRCEKENYINHVGLLSFGYPSQSYPLCLGMLIAVSSLHACVHKPQRYGSHMAAVLNDQLLHEYRMSGSRTNPSSHGCCLLQVIGDWVALHSLEEVLEAMKKARVPSGAQLSTASRRRWS